VRDIVRFPIIIHNFPFFVYCFFRYLPQEHDTAVADVSQTESQCHCSKHRTPVAITIFQFVRQVPQVVMKIM